MDELNVTLEIIDILENELIKNQKKYATNKANIALYSNIEHLYNNKLNKAYMSLQKQITALYI